MKEFLVRPATMSDLDVLLGFEQGVIKAERPFDPTLAADPISYYDLKKLIESEDAQVLVVTNKDEIVASGYARIKAARHYLDHELYSYLGFMYTSPDFRGKGINKIIIDALKKWSAAKGLKEIRLTVYDENRDAIRAYEKVGFKKYIIEMRLE